MTAGTDAPPSLALLRALLRAAAVLATAVIVLGAYVRLSDAGLSCPDWPGCYGQLTVPSPHEHAAAPQLFPERPLHPGKAWKEMLHRYLAATLGLLAMASAALAWLPPIRRRHHPAPATLLLGLIVGQALLGMWTVTLLLKPLVVTAHLLGGMSTLALLLWMHWRHYGLHPQLPKPLRLRARLLLATLFLQLALGGWTSSNYAAPGCPDLPACHSQWLPPMDFAHGFTLVRELGQTGNGELLSQEALTAIHWSHRLGALLVVTAALALLAALRRHGNRGLAVWLGSALVLQLGLGIANVTLQWPIPLAVAHNAGAVLLLAGTLAALCGVGARRPEQERTAANRNVNGKDGISRAAMPPTAAW